MRDVIFDLKLSFQILFGATRIHLMGHRLNQRERHSSKNNWIFEERFGMKDSKRAWTEI